MHRPCITRFALLLSLAACVPGGRALAQGIADNSFLIEEAYNQEPGVVQHISTWQRSLQVSSWSYAFTQEWPVGSEQHQLSYTLLVGYAARTNVDFNGLGLNYRYQLTPADGRVAIAPRVSALMPSHDRVGAQVALPLSLNMGSHFVSHWDAGVTMTPRSLTIYNLGASVVWLARQTFNVLYEVTWTSGPDRAVTLMNPGVRWAYNFASGLQIVPGLAYTFGLGPEREGQGVFVYLSFEHPF
jgi:hypothetical protein